MGSQSTIIRAFFVFVFGSNVVKHEQPLPLPDLPPPPAIEDGGPPQPAKPAWRTVHKRPERKRKQITAGTPAPPPAPQLASPPVKPETPSWAQWRRTLFWRCSGNFTLMCCCRCLQPITWCHLCRARQHRLCPLHGRSHHPAWDSSVRDWGD